jgi:hypothetical protein
VVEYYIVSDYYILILPAVSIFPVIPVVANQEIVLNHYALALLALSTLPALPVVSAVANWKVVWVYKYFMPGYLSSQVVFDNKKLPQ